MEAAHSEILAEVVSNGTVTSPARKRGTRLQLFTGGY